MWDDSLMVAPDKSDIVGHKKSKKNRRAGLKRLKKNICTESACQLVKNSKDE